MNAKELNLKIAIIKFLDINNVPYLSPQKNDFEKWDAFHKLQHDKGVRNEQPDIFLPNQKTFLRIGEYTEAQKEYDSKLSKEYTIFNDTDYIFYTNFIKDKLNEKI